MQVIMPYRSSARKPTQLLYFSPFMNIILSPHFDDAVLSLGGLLAREGRDTLVATFFAGTPAVPLVRAWDKKCWFADSTQAMRERTEENRKSLRFFGLSDDRIRNYEHLDVQYRFASGNPETPEPELEDMVKKEINSLLQEFTSDSVKVFMPGFAVHPDHALMKNAALVVARESTVPFFLYQDLPYAWQILEMERKPREYSLLERSVTRGMFAVTPHAIPLTEADMEKKLAGVALYASQIPHLGTQFLEKLERLSATQARSLSLPDPYCEVTYALTS